ncbi:MAG TPA: molybdate ABC transporter substrate-binding protein [Anaerolineales bacterium]|jgi:molybdate transport system substrate-binding protein
MKYFGMILLSVILFVSACSRPIEKAITQSQAARHVTLNVFAAASLTDAFEEIGSAFEAAHPGLTVKFNFAGSQTLRTQIEQGAEADVFASANTKEMDKLVAGNYVAADSAKIFLTNHLVLVMPANNPAGITKPADLAKPGIKVILAAKDVPVGGYSLQMLDNLEASLGPGFKNKVLKNVVSYENDVKQVLAKVQLGEADAGIVYSSDMSGQKLQNIVISPEMNVIAKYPLAAMTHSAHLDQAEAFVNFVLSAEGQAILKKWGFSSVN